jgi:hypothetical protein
MVTVPLKAAARYVGGLVTAAFFVVLLSFTFSFLGTIFCAALGGMMLGALRTHKWQALPVSLLFPLVIFILLKGMKTELAGRQVLLVSFACFSVFWLTYGVAATLFLFERKGQPQAGCPTPNRSVPAARPEAERAARTAATPGAGKPKQNGRLSLEMLQGTWSREASAHAQFPNRRMSIQKERLTLFIVDSSGQDRFLAQAQVEFCPVGAPQTLRLSEPAAEAGSDTLVSI